MNIPLLRKAVEWAEAEAAKPEIDREWFQGRWRLDPEVRGWSLLLDAPNGATRAQEVTVSAHCGTAYCIAGYVAQSVAGDYATDVRPPGMPHVAEFAAEALGIESADVFSPPVGHLFHEGNTVADVRRIAEDLAGERL